jgi:hypothetical protein
VQRLEEMAEEYMSALKVRRESFARLQRAAILLLFEPDVSRSATFFNAPSALIAEFSNGFLTLSCGSALNSSSALMEVMSAEFERALGVVLRGV